VLTTDLAKQLGLGEKTGVRVTRLMSAKPAPLQVGDIITAIDGDPVLASQPSDADLFATMVRQYKIGSTVTLTVLRDGKEQQVPFVPSSLRACRAR
jgi:S1-C subfamily serine protease